MSSLFKWPDASRVKECGKRKSECEVFNSVVSLCLSLLSAHILLTKCLSPVDAGETKSRRAFSSPSWWSVRSTFELSSSSAQWTFALLRVGASGTGRTTFVNTLCESEVLAHKVSDTPETAHIEEGIRIKPANIGSCCRACNSGLKLLNSFLL